MIQQEKILKALSSGFIMKSLGWVENNGFQLLIDNIKLYDIDIIIVLGYERLYNKLIKHSSINDITKVKLLKSPGIEQQSGLQRNLKRNLMIKSYFYGLYNELSPYQKIFHYQDIAIYKAPVNVGGNNEHSNDKNSNNGGSSMDSMLPMGQKATLDLNKPVLVTPSPHILLHSMLSVSYASTPDELFTSQSAGYVYVSAMNTEQQTITLLTPSISELPSQLLVLGTIKWQDS